MKPRAGDGGRLRPSFTLLPIALLVTLFAPAASNAQVFRAQAGTSTLTQSTGGSFDVRARSYEASIGAGELFGQFRLGAVVRKKFKRHTISFGDDAIDFALPTDTLGGRYPFLVRGAGLTVARRGFSMFALAGATANGAGSPFFRGAETAGSVGLLFLEKQVAPHWRLYSRNVFSGQQTSLQGVEWLAAKSLKVAATGGIGAGEGYAATSAAYDGRRVDVRAGYVTAGRAFRRILIDSPSSAESNRESLSIAIHPSASWSMTASHQNLLQPEDRSGPMSRMTVNHLGGNVNIEGIRVSAGLFEAHGDRTPSVGASIGVGRAFTANADASLTYFRSTSAHDPPSDSVVATLRETLGPRLTLVQVATHTSGQTSLKFGGSFLSNPLVVGLDYQTVYAPFRTGNPFVQAITLSVRVAIRNLQIQTGTFTTPTGRTRYTVSGNQSVYRAQGSGGGSRDVVRFARYVIRGRVLEEDGRPVTGAVVRINGEVVLTDGAGEFLLRTKKAKPCPIEVVTGEFLGPGYFAVSSAPETAVPAPEENASPITIRVKRVDPPAAGGNGK